MKYGAWLLCIVLVLPVSVQARSSGVSMERVLDPLREFDPFDEAVAAERYFPDEIERRVRRAITDALLQRPDRLREHLSRVEAEDEKRTAQGDEPSGLTPLVRELHRAQASRTGQGEESAGNRPGADDDLERAEALLADNNVVRWSGFLNRLLGAMDLVQLASGSYLTAAFETAFVEVQRTRAPHMPAAERKALALYKRFLDRFPDDRRSADVGQKAAALDAKKKDVWVRRQLDAAGEALDGGDIAEAEFHTRLAAIVDPEADDVEKRFREIDAARHARRESRRRQLSVADADNLSGAGPERRRDIRTLLYALVKGDAAEAEKQARDMVRRYRGETLGNVANDARAVALELGGRHEEAKRTLQEIARTSPSRRDRKRARILLDSPEYNLLEMVDRARTGYRMEQVRFVLLGENFLEKNALIGAAPVITHGAAGAATLGAANILMVSSNLLELLSGNPVSNQTVVDAAARYVRARPRSEKSGDVYQVLGGAYESQGHPHKALHYYRLSGKIAPERIRELEENAAKTLLKAAEKTDSKANRRIVYAAILEHYPETSAGEQAKGRLARLLSVESRGLRLSKQFLEENPRLYGPEGLGLKAALFDGNAHNLELAEPGLNVLGRNTLLLHYDTPWGTRTRTHSVARQRIENLEALLREKHYALARLDGDAESIEAFPSQLMKFEDRDRRPDPADMEFIRRTGRDAGPGSPILDHELLSKKESDPQQAYGLPTVRGSVTPSGVSLSAEAPKSFLAEELVVGNDSVSPYAGVRLPIPFLKEFVPVDFMLRARPGLPSITPQIRRPEGAVDDAHLYR